MNLLIDSFLIDYARLITELGKLLNTTLGDDGSRKLGPIRKMSKDALSYHLKSQTESRNWEFTKLLLLEKNLREVQGRDPALLEVFRRKLNSDRLDDYIGSRFELNIAATLIRKGIAFEMPDPPDFIVEFQRSESAIECGSAHLPNNRSGDLLYKVSSVINQKAQKPYCKPTTALCIDFTNVHYNSVLNGQVDSSGTFDARLRTHLNDAVQHTQFGAILLFSTHRNFGTYKLESMYIRENNNNIDASLRDFLDYCFPIDRRTAHQIEILEHR